MSEKWAERQRRTNLLVGMIADYLFRQKSVLPDQLYGLCKLTWITNSYDGEDAAYIYSTKIPALERIFSRNYLRSSLNEVAEDISNITGAESCKKLILSHTGFTNLFKVYRNSSEEWIKNNFDALLPLFQNVRKLDTDDEGPGIIHEIDKLPGIPNPGDKQRRMRPEYLLTPIFFALDPRLRFPIINGNQGVRRLLSKLKVSNASLEEQYWKMIGLYGIGGIKDAADLDQLGQEPSDFIDIVGERPTRKLLEVKPVSNEIKLPLKDESDIESLQESRTIIKKQIHNGLTNKLREYLSDYVLLEGHNKSAMFDVLVKGYEVNKADLLIEVKSSVEAAHIRMAIGQLFDYWFSIKGDVKPHLAILLPASPDDQIKQMLEWLNIGVLWFSDDTLKTCTKWLQPFVGKG